MDGEAELETSAASVRAARAFVAAFDSFRASGALPTQVNSRVSQTRTDVDEHDRESSSVSLHSPGAPKRQRLAPAEPTLRNGEAKQASAVNGAAASSSDHVADAILRHAGDQSVLLFTLLSTQLKQVSFSYNHSHSLNSGIRKLLIPIRWKFIFDAVLIAN